MMRIPMKVDYGVRALLELAMHYGQGRIQTSEIAYRQGIPEAYLNQLMPTLNKVGFVCSRRGPQGGHALAMEPADISLGVLMSTLEKNTPPLDCFIHPNDCILSDFCAQKEVWRLVEDTVQNVLNNITLADLSQRQSQFDSHRIYQI